MESISVRYESNAASYWARVSATSESSLSMRRMLEIASILGVLPFLKDAIDPSSSLRIRARPSSGTKSERCNPLAPTSSLPAELDPEGKVGVIVLE